jgi:hypothetical protein
MYPPLPPHREPSRRRRLQLEALELNSADAGGAADQALVGDGGERFLAKITGLYNPTSGLALYSWRYAVEDEDTSADALNRADPARFFGGPAQTQLPAWEITGNDNVPIDGSAIVELWASPGGLYYSFFLPAAGVWARLTAGGGPYAWIAQIPNAGGHHTDDPAGPEGTTTVNPAYEVNGRPAELNTLAYLTRGAGACPDCISAVVVHGDGVAISPEHSLYIVNAVGGYWTITLFDELGNAETTAPLAGNPLPPASTVEAALRALPSWPLVSVTGTGTAGAPYLILLADVFEDVPLLLGDPFQLEGVQEWWFDAPVSNTFDSFYITVNNITYISITVNTYINIAYFNVYNTIVNFYETTIVNFYSITNVYNTIVFIDGIVWGNPTQVELVTKVCYFAFTLQVWQTDQLGSSPVPVLTAATGLVTATFTLAQATNVIVTGNVEWLLAPGGGTAAAVLTVDGTVQAHTLPESFPVGPIDHMATQQWVVRLAAGNHIILLSASCGILSLGQVASGPNTNLTLHADGVLITEHTLFYLPNGVLYFSPDCRQDRDCCPPGGTPPPPCALCSPLYPIADQWIIWFTLDGCGGAGTAGPACDCCPDATPTAWQFKGSGFSGNLAGFNGLQTLGDMTSEPGVECVWNLQGPLFPGDSGSVLWPCAAGPQLTLGAEDSFATYVQNPEGPSPTPCCGSITLQNVSGTQDDAPQYITLTPIGCGPAGGDITGPIIVDYQGGCCWYGVSEANPTIAARWCVQQNPDGTTSWVLTILQNGVAIASYVHNNGFADVDCCADVLDIPLRSTSCAALNKDPANAYPLGCEGYSSYSGPSGILVPCCAGQPLPATFRASFIVTPPHGPCDSCFPSLVFDITYYPGFFPPGDPTNPDGNAWVGTFDCFNEGENTVALECLVSGVFRLQIRGPCSPLGTPAWQNIGPASASCPPSFQIRSFAFNPTSTCCGPPYPGLTLQIMY